MTTGDEDSSLFLDIAESAPDRVAVIGLRRVVFPQRDHGDAVCGVPVVAAPNAAELVPLLRACIGLEQPRGAPVRHWLLTAIRAGQRREWAARLDRG